MVIRTFASSSRFLQSMQCLRQSHNGPTRYHPCSRTKAKNKSHLLFPFPQLKVWKSRVKGDSRITIAEAIEKYYSYGSNITPPASLTITAPPATSLIRRKKIVNQVDCGV